MKTVFITGASAGIGRKTAEVFAENGWNVAATMRHPEKENSLQNQNISLFECDVTDSKSIKTAIDNVVQKFGTIDAVVNNAGFYTVGAFEAASEEQITQQINTNLKGSMLVTQFVLPYFRRQRNGVIVNVSSIAGLISIPFQTLYHATKWGIEGFSESLQFELKPFNIRVKLIEPGVINTDFYGRSMSITQSDNINEYQKYADIVVGNLRKNGSLGSLPDEVAKKIFSATTDKTYRLRYRVGKSKNMPLLRKILPLRWYQKLVDIAMQEKN